MALIYAVTLLIVWTTLILTLQHGNRLIAKKNLAVTLGRQVSVAYNGGVLFIGIVSTSSITQIFSMTSMLH